MKKLVLFFTISTIFLSNQTIHTERIAAIFFDVEAIFHADSLRASGYIGKIDSLRYMAEVGHLPSQEDLFKQLKPIKAQSTEVTYNKNLPMPLIFSDWLATIQTSTKIKDTIQKYFNNKNISEIEKKVLFAIVSMMLTPQHLADIQKIHSKVEQILEKLKNQGIKLYLVGNWAHVASLKSQFSHLFSLFHGVYVSGDLHLLKPSQEYYQMVLSKTSVHANQALWIETESKFATKAKQYGLKVTSCNPDNHDSLAQALRQHGISV